MMDDTENKQMMMGDTENKVTLILSRRCRKTRNDFCNTFKTSIVGATCFYQKRISY